MQIFSNLMATRATPLYPIHVESLNRIDIEFYEDKKVVNAWKLLHDNFANYPKDPNARDYDAQLTSCSEKSKDLLTDLLFEMSKVLGYDFDKVLLKRGCYIPKGHGDVEFEQDFIRSGMVNLLKGEASIPIQILAPPASGISSEEKLRQLLIDHYEGNKPIRVIIEGADK